MKVWVCTFGQCTVETLS